jgi:hypothetical protein
MSNVSILSRLESELAAFEKKARTAEEFSTTLYACVEAMEGISQSVRDEIRRLQFVLDRVCQEERGGLLSDRAPVVASLRAALSRLPREPIQPPEPMSGLAPGHGSS